MYSSNNNGGHWLCPRIMSDDQSSVYYGGKSEWFVRNTAAKSGYGVVAGVNVLISLALKDSFYQKRFHISFDENNIIDQKNFTFLMYKLYLRMGIFETPILNLIYDKSRRDKKYILPVSFFANLPLFIRGMLHFSSKHNIALTYDSLYTLNCNYTRGLTFIKLGLSYGNPIVLLTTNNHFDFILYDEPYYQKPHKVTMKKTFVTITDIQETTSKNAPDLIVSIDGKMGRIPYSDLHNSWQSYKAYGSGMTYFSASDTFQPYSWVLTEFRTWFKNIRLK